MFFSFPFFPPQASSTAAEVDLLFIYLIAVSVFFTALIFILLMTFAIKYRRRTVSECPPPNHGLIGLEIFWTVIPLLITMTFFGWGTTLFFKNSRVPANALEIFVVGKQWMWKIQHPEGPREINELHVPLGTPIKLKMTSEDVIHSFFVPAFRIKMDVVPGRYTTAWFKAIKSGRYHLFCAEYCGTKHSGMIGFVHVMEENQYQNWLARGTSASGMDISEPLQVQGEKIFKHLRCDTCHLAGAKIQAPELQGLFGKKVLLTNAQTITADEGYIRESILQPKSKQVEGYEPVMPTYQNQISEEEIIALIAYLKSLGDNDVKSIQNKMSNLQLETDIQMKS